MKYDRITWMGWLIIITVLAFILFAYLMLFGKWGIPIFIGVVVGGIIVGANREEKDITIDDDEYFTDEDFIYSKIGEWVSRKWSGGIK